MAPTADQIELLQGTLDMLILKTLLFGPAHGHGIAKHIQHSTRDVLVVEHGSLYPALHRLEDNGFVSSEWGTSENNRRAKYYRLTARGRKQLEVETQSWERFAEAVSLVLRLA